MYLGLEVTAEKGGGVGGNAKRYITEEAEMGFMSFEHWRVTKDSIECAITVHGVNKDFPNIE
jgi:hypothetical protein